MAIDSRIRRIFADVLSEPAAAALLDESTMSDVDGWDSQTFIGVIMGIESEFDIRLSTLEAARMSSLSEIAAVLREKGVRLES